MLVHDANPVPAASFRDGSPGRQSSAARRRSPALALALQGGGAHGAFTWGVLDALLEDGRWSFTAISGASAGAMNAVVTAQGLVRGGADGAREALERFWLTVADRLGFEALDGAGAAPPPGDAAGDAAGDAEGDAEGDAKVFPSRLHHPLPLVQATRHWSAWMAPWFGAAAGNPLGLAPLAQIVAEQIDFDALRDAAAPALFIAATHATSGRLRLFREHELSADALLASACLPSLAAPVMIDGEPWIDGAFAANPPLVPLVTEARAADVLLVLLTPLAGRAATDAAGSAPGSSAACLELALHAGFRAEWRTLQALQAARAEGGAARWWQRGWQRGWPGRSLRWWPERALSWWPGRAAKGAAPRWHLIDSHPRLAALHADSRLHAGRRYFLALRDLGRERGREWLEELR